MNEPKLATFLAEFEQLKIRLVGTQEAELIENEFNRIDEMTAEEVKFQLVADSFLQAKKTMGSEPISDLERGNQPAESTLFVHSKRSADNTSELKPSRRYARPFSAHLNAMAQRITDLFDVFLFGVNGNIARADDGRRRASRSPGVTWVQEGIELTIAAGIDADRRLEVELFLGSASGREPHTIFWADPKTLSGDNIVVDLFDIHRSGNGRYLVGIKKPELERRLAAISKERNEGHADKAIAFSPLVQFG